MIKSGTHENKRVSFWVKHVKHTIWLPWWLSSKASACNTGDSGSILGPGRSPREGNGNPLQCSCLENSMDREAWQATVHGVAKSQTWLSNSHTHTHTHTHTHNDMMDKMLKYKVFGDASLRGGNDLLTFMNKLESLNSAVSNSILLTMLLPQFPKCTVSSITHSTSITTSHLTIPC